MEVYIEYVIIDNMVIDFLIGFLTLRALKIRVVKLRLLAFSVMGTAFAFLFPLISLPAAALLALRLGSGAAMCFVLCSHKSVKRYLVCFSVFMGVTFLMGGAALGLLFLTGADISKAATLSYDASVPVGIIALAAAVSVFMIKRLTVYLHRVRDSSGFCRKVRIECGGKGADLNGFVDSGNRLYDKRSGLPVVLIAKNALLDLISDSLMDLLFAQNLYSGGAAAAGGKKGVFREGHYIDLTTASGEGRVFVFRPDKFWIYSPDGGHKIYDVMLGLYKSGFGDAAEYDCLLHPALSESS